jgi:hypothetical protein
MLHHDKAPAHTSLLLREFLAKHETTVVPPPHFSRFGPYGLVGSGVETVEGSTLKETSLIKL